VLALNCIDILWGRVSYISVCPVERTCEIIISILNDNIIQFPGLTQLPNYQVNDNEEGMLIRKQFLKLALYGVSCMSVDYTLCRHKLCAYPICKLLTYLIRTVTFPDIIILALESIISLCEVPINLFANTSIVLNTHIQNVIICAKCFIEFGLCEILVDTMCIYKDNINILNKCIKIYYYLSPYTSCSGGIWGNTRILKMIVSTIETNTDHISLVTNGLFTINNLCNASPKSHVESILRSCRETGVCTMVIKLLSGKQSSLVWKAVCDLIQSLSKDVIIKEDFGHANGIKLLSDTVIDPCFDESLRLQVHNTLMMIVGNSKPNFERLKNSAYGIACRLNWTTSIKFNL